MIPASTRTIKKIYFPNLNGLRFFAATLVILHHFGFTSGWVNAPYIGNFILGVGKLGVILFFTLSGFLITYLLLKEKRETGEIHIRNFYIRRVLRIWPLYFIMVIGALYILNNLVIFRIPDISALVHHDFFLKNILYIFFLSNVAYAFGYVLPFADQVWSIGVEEQFYIFWPALFLKKRNTLKLMMIIIVIFIILKVSCYFFSLWYPGDFSQRLFFLISISSFDSMALGGIAAYLLFTKNRIIKDILFKEITQIIVYIILVISLISGLNFGLFHYEYFSLLFTILILNLAGNPDGIINIENRVLNYLGLISYGLYMFQFVSMRLVDLFMIYVIKLTNWEQFFLILLLTIGISAFSYEFIEKYFIRRKFLFSSILSNVERP